MTTMTKEEVPTQKVVTVPETLTEAHHEALRASWELPAHEREASAVAAQRSGRMLLVGLITGAVCLAAGFGAGYWAHPEAVEAAAPIVISRVAGLTDANGMNLGRRLAPIETTLPVGITLAGPVDAHGAPLGRRVPPFETQTPTELPVRPLTDANGMTLGPRVAPVE